MSHPANRARKTLLLLSALVTLSAPALALTLPEALMHLNRRTSVLSALTERQDAEVNLSRVQRDPLALRTDEVQAKQRLTLAEVQLEQTRYSTMSELVSGYTAVLSAEKQLAVAQESLAVSQNALTIARIRLESGSATEQDAKDAEAAVAQAESGVSATEQGRDLALNSLGSLLGEQVMAGSLEGVPANFFVGVPPLKAVLKNAERHPDLLGVEQQAASAQLAADVLDPLYAPESDIESVASQLQNAQAGVRETRRGFLLQVRNLHAQAGSARKNVSLAADALAASQARLETQAQRLGGGLISKLDFQQAELEAQSTASDAQKARTDYLNALLSLQSGSLTPLRGPFATALTLRSGE